jgi:hypothetical protein
MSKKYKVIVHNKDVPEGEDNTNIQFFANDKLVNIKEGEPTIISEAAYNNLVDAQQERWKWNKATETNDKYIYKRHAVTLIEEIDDGIPEDKPVIFPNMEPKPEMKVRARA